MQHYWGLQELSARLGVKSYTGLKSLVCLQAAPIYPRLVKRNKMRYRRKVLYSNEILILTWELEQARMRRELWRAQREDWLQVRRDAHHARKVKEALPIRRIA